MKSDIHPSYEHVTVTCVCGESYETRTTMGAYSLDVCAACHPFYTGKQRLMDTQGRIDRFRKKYGTAS